MRCTCACTGRTAQRCFSRYRNLLQIVSVAAAVVAYCFILGSFAVDRLRTADVHLSLTYLNATIDEPKVQDTNAVWETESYNYNSGYLEEIYEMRREHVWEVCIEKGLNTRGQPNAWEFFIDKDHHLVWCSIFKAASSTWMYHFNILAGYNEKFLRRTRKTLISLARARFPRPSVQQLQEALPNALSFLIVREPYERLLSAYRNKIEGAGNPYYRKLSKLIAQQARSKHKQGPMADVPNNVKSGPTFPEFVEYVINSRKFDEHWAPYHSFCTPCHVNFTVIAKMETLDRDEEYIIHKAGLQRLLLASHFRFKPRAAVNKARDGKATAELVEKYYSQLTKDQMEKLHKIYGTDFEMFDYNATKYFNFVQSQQ